jgi:hypothetical protein
MPELGYGQLLWIVRIVLLVCVTLHITAAIQLTRMSWAARPIRYNVKRNIETTFAARVMRWGGILLAVFVVDHLLHLTGGVVGFESGQFKHAAKNYRNDDDDCAPYPDHCHVDRDRSSRFGLRISKIRFDRRRRSAPLEHGLWSCQLLHSVFSGINLGCVDHRRPSFGRRPCHNRLLRRLAYAVCVGVWIRT